ncbi:hypothetical protein OG976_24060 [Mycobacterium sp. NBC_00419]|uniref:hypothetical protein n=1 Tax=Mycobacterium sp. NBC_00419 TaxID=2975989 RepID=UPI002E238B02
MNLLTADPVVDAPTAHGIHTMFVIPEPSVASPVETDQDAAVAEPAGVIEECDVVSPEPVTAEPSFHLSTQMILAVIVTTVILTALAVTAVASFAPQGFSAGT